MDADVISKMENVITEQEEGNKNAYAEIAVIQYVNNLDNKTSVSKDESFDMKEYAEQANLNMDFFGIDLSQVPKNNWKDFKVLIIPILYIISSFVSIRLSMNTNNKQNKEKKLITDGKEQEEEKYNPMDDANKTMVWMMPIMSVSIAAIAPLGLALYWLMNNILMIVERLVYNKIFEKEEAEENA